MKILVLSLLRAGDLVMQRPLFAAIKERSKDCELHVLINDEVSWIAPLLGEVDQIHIFPRKLLQRLVGEAQHNIFRASLELSNFLGVLNGENFDEVMNFTHNRLSAYVTEEVQASSKKGLSTEGFRFLGMDNKWLKLFNDRFSGTQPFPFHYTEILAHSFDLKVKLPLPHPPRKVKRVFLQVLTSDLKKNWGLVNYRNLLNELYREYPQVPFRILGSEGERSQLEKYFEKEEICTWDLVTLEKEFNSTDLLITGDTVTMHIAAQKAARIIEIAVGSSDPWKTGPYGSGHFILMSEAHCYPCVHSTPCRQLSHLCSQPITPQIVKAVVEGLMEGQAPWSKALGSVRLLKTVVGEYGYELQGENSRRDLKLLNKILWQKIMNQQQDLQVRSVLKLGFKSGELQDLQSELAENLHLLQSDFENLVQRLGVDNLRLSDIQEARRRMGCLTVAPGNQEWIWMFLDLSQLAFPRHLHFLSAFQDRLEILKGAIFYRNEMMTVLTEIPTEELHESGPRTVPKSGLIEA